MYTKREMLFPSPFTYVQGKVATPLTNFVIYLKGAELWLQKTQSYTFTMKKQIYSLERVSKSKCGLKTLFYFRRGRDHFVIN